VRRRQSGHVLIVALFVLAVTMAAAAMIAGSLGYRMWLVRQESRNLHLTALADGALALALAELSVDRSYGGTGGPVPWDDGTYAIEVRPSGLNESAVEVRVTYGGGGRAALAEVELLPVRVVGWQPIAFNP
jgi:hypothetical protein